MLVYCLPPCPILFYAGESELGAKYKSKCRPPGGGRGRCAMPIPRGWGGHWAVKVSKKFRGKPPMITFSLLTGLLPTKKILETEISEIWMLVCKDACFKDFC